MDKFETLEDYQNSLKEFNERTRKSYENFIQEHGDDSQKLQLRCTPYTEKKGRYGVASLDFGFQIWQSQQAEVDELNQLYLKAQHQEIRHRTIAQDALALVEEKDKRIEELESALTQIKLWESHPKNYETNFGSWGLRDFYRDLAEKALRGEHEA